MVQSKQLERLYRQLILDHAQHPRHYGQFVTDGIQVTLHNPSCGDTVHVQITVADDRLTDIRFAGEGCTISQASASMMTECLCHRTLAQAQALTQHFLALLRGEEEASADLGDAAVLQGVKQFPARMKCATLAWQAVAQAMARYETRGDTDE